VIVRPCGITIARIGVARWHRRQPRVIGGLVAFEAVGADGWPVGVAIVGRPVSRHLQARGLVEVTRVATDETRNACSMLYGACARWARKHNVTIFTDTHADEGGASLRGAGWVVVSMRAAVKGKGWSSRPGRAATDRAPKVRWSPAWCADAVRGSMV
jgi:hypothetical protein